MIENSSNYGDRKRIGKVQIAGMQNRYKTMLIRISTITMTVYFHQNFSDKISSLVAMTV